MNAEKWKMDTAPNSRNILQHEWVGLEVDVRPVRMDGRSGQAACRTGKVVFETKNTVWVGSGEAGAGVRVIPKQGSVFEFTIVEGGQRRRVAVDGAQAAVRPEDRIKKLTPKRN